MLSELLLAFQPGLRAVIRHCFQSCLLSFPPLLYKYLIHVSAFAALWSSAKSVEQGVTSLVLAQVQGLLPDFENGNQVMLARTVSTCDCGVRQTLHAHCLFDHFICCIYCTVETKLRRKSDLIREELVGCQIL